MEERRFARTVARRGLRARRHCVRCGAELPPTARFCGKCWAPAPSSTAPMPLADLFGKIAIWALVSLGIFATVSVLVLVFVLVGV